MGEWLIQPFNKGDYLSDMDKSKLPLLRKLFDKVTQVANK